MSLAKSRNKTKSTDPSLRLVIIGKSGSGKSTLANQLSHALTIPHIELDSLFWLPNWQKRPVPEFWHAAETAMSDSESISSSWIMDGNYARLRPLIWARANTLVWLDYALPLVLWRVVKRTAWRVVTRKKVCGDNVETGRDVFRWDWDRNLVMYCIRSHYRHRKEFPKLFVEGGEFAHLKVVRLKSPGETRKWMEELLEIEQ